MKFKKTEKPRQSNIHSFAFFCILPHGLFRLTESLYKPNVRYSFQIVKMKQFEVLIGYSCQTHLIWLESWALSCSIRLNTNFSGTVLRFLHTAWTLSSSSWFSIMWGHFSLVPSIIPSAVFCMRRMEWSMEGSMEVWKEARKRPVFYQ